MNYRVNPIHGSVRALDLLLAQAQSTPIEPCAKEELPLREALQHMFGIDNVVITGVNITRCLVGEADFIKAADYFKVKTLKRDGQIHFDASFSYKDSPYDVSFAMYGQIENGFMRRNASKFWLVERVK